MNPLCTRAFHLHLNDGERWEISKAGSPLQLKRLHLLASIGWSAGILHFPCNEDSKGETNAAIELAFKSRSTAEAILLERDCFKLKVSRISELLGGGETRVRGKWPAVQQHFTFRISLLENRSQQGQIIQLNWLKRLKYLGKFDDVCNSSRLRRDKSDEQTDINNYWEKACTRKRQPAKTFPISVEQSKVAIAIEVITD